MKKRAAVEIELRDEDIRRQSKERERKDRQEDKQRIVHTGEERSRRRRGHEKEEKRCKRTKETEWTVVASPRTRLERRPKTVVDLRPHSFLKAQHSRQLSTSRYIIYIYVCLRVVFDRREGVEMLEKQTESLA